MTALPLVNDPILLRDEAERSFRSRVEALDTEVVTVARPLDLPVDHDDVPDAPILVTWACPRGVGVLPTRLLGTHTEGGLALWSMSITGPSWVEQRRNFVRVPAGGPLTLQLQGTEPPAGTAVIGHLVDLSEAALRCAVDPAAIGVITEGSEVAAGFRFGTADFVIPGRVGLRPGGGSDELVELLVVFDEPDRYGDALRKQIFAQQRRSLRPWS